MSFSDLPFHLDSLSRYWSKLNHQAVTYRAIVQKCYSGRCHSGSNGHGTDADGSAVILVYIRAAVSLKTFIIL